MLPRKCDMKLLRIFMKFLECASQSFCQSVFTKDSCLCTAYDFNKAEYF